MMMNTRILISCLLLASACVRKAHDEGNDEGLDIARLEEGCKAWCQVAVPCSEHFAGPAWGEFSTQTECEDACIMNIEYLTTQNPACFDIVLDERECAAALSCDEFKQYENFAFAEPAASPSCVERVQETLYNCNL